MTDYREHPDWLALVRAVCAAPDDDLPRLVAADWLDENGKPERAEFIRVGCVLATMEREAPSSFRHGEGVALRRRERELFDRHKCEWFGERWSILTLNPDDHGDFDLLTVAAVRRGFVFAVVVTSQRWCGSECEACYGEGGPPHDVGYEGPDGFVSTWEPCGHCDGAGRLPSLGREVVAVQPVERVELTDTRPHRAGGTFCWYDGDFLDPATPGLGEMPGDLFAVMWELFPAHRREDEHIRWVAFDTRDAADAAVSDGLLVWAKAPEPA